MQRSYPPVKEIPKLQVSLNQEYRVSLRNWLKKWQASAGWKNPPGVGEGIELKDFYTSPSWKKKNAAWIGRLSGWVWSGEESCLKQMGAKRWQQVVGRVCSGFSGLSWFLGLDVKLSI